MSKILVIKVGYERQTIRPQRNMSLRDDTIQIVLDTGSSFTKAGFAGEASPRCVFPTTVARFRHAGMVDGFPDIYCGYEAIQKRGLSRMSWPVQSGLIQDWEEMEKLWHHTFYKELHVPPEETRVIHAVHPLISRIDKEKMAEVLFESFAIKGLYLAKSPALTLYASGRTSGVVWEGGFSCAYAAPVFEGFTLKHSTAMSPITGEKLTDCLNNMLKPIGYSFTTPFERDLLIQLKAQKCYVAKNYEEELRQTSVTERIRFTLPDGQHVFIGQERVQCPEVLFKPCIGGLSCPSIVETICFSINKCDLDYRPMLYNNIIVSGGSSMFPNLVERLEQELSLKVKSLPGYKAHVDATASRDLAVWAGGSIVASLSLLEGFWMTKQEYEDTGPDKVNHKFF